MIRHVSFPFWQREAGFCVCLTRKYKITEIALTNSLNLARAQQLPLSEILQRPDQVPS